MTTPHLGAVSVSVIAGEIQATSQPAHSDIGKQVRMGDSGLYFHIKPEVARQWLPIIQKIAGEE